MEGKFCNSLKNKLNYLKEKFLIYINKKAYHWAKNHLFKPIRKINFINNKIEKYKKDYFKSLNNLKVIEMKDDEIWKRIYDKENKTLNLNFYKEIDWILIMPFYIEHRENFLMRDIDEWILWDLSEWLLFELQILVSCRSYWYIKELIVMTEELNWRGRYHTNPFNDFYWDKIKYLYELLWKN